MSNRSVLTACLSFIGGVGFGAFAMYQHMKEIRRAEQKEIEDYYHDQVAATMDHLREVQKDCDNTVSEYKKQIASLSSKLEIKNINSELQEQLNASDIYEIDETEYGGEPKYARYQYRYYPDDECYVNSSYDIPIDDEEIADMLGPVDPAKIFEASDFEKEAVYVRNDPLECDIAIFLAEGSFEGPDDE